MVASLSFHSIATVNHIYSGDAGRSISRRNCQFRATGVSCRGQNEQQTSKGPEPENVLLKIAWYGSELLGIAASVFRSPETSPPSVTGFEVPVDCSGRAVRVAVVDSIKQDFKRSYFVTGNLTPEVYEEKCEFADPAGSFKGLARFRRNCTNFGSLIEKSNMKLMKWENFEFVLQDKGVGHWKFSCVMSFPWKPILSATGYTEYYFDTESGKICRHVENWNVPKIALFKQLLRPSRGLMGN
ncbi:PREDICTED: uncharacterized protein LOC104793579 isoform X1 [Camelina sativa]|uniref:Uncharacterized protein LOC104793579 isoform X1 n=1 Tax=Camelina sativa TaxID=90675 RepID=A0ABM0ZNJ9_CAMSA|nr:PREDICTED: uncharacterized protein LOC104793579 isoform X1 [Camelina sativa]